MTAREFLRDCADIIQGIGDMTWAPGSKVPAEAKAKAAALRAIAARFDEEEARARRATMSEHATEVDLVECGARIALLARLDAPLDASPAPSPALDPVTLPRPPKRLFVDNGVLRIPEGTPTQVAVHAVFDALAEGEKFMVQDERRALPGEPKAR
jgi:hypothetical protein